MVVNTNIMQDSNSGHFMLQKSEPHRLTLLNRELYGWILVLFSNYYFKISYNLKITSQKIIFMVIFMVFLRMVHL